MKKLSNQQKINLYKKMIDKLQKTYYSGFCGAFVGVTSYNAKDMLKLLPELKKYKPHEIIIKHYDSYWFDIDDNEIRVKILKYIIENLKKRR